MSVFEDLIAVFDNIKAEKSNYKPVWIAMAHVTVDLENNVKLCD